MLNLDAICTSVRAAFESRFDTCVLHTPDWDRLKFAAHLADGDAALDVGTAHGALLHILAETKAMRCLTGMDIRQHSQAWLRDDVDYIAGSIANPQLNLPMHDTVYCMEVLEHLTPGEMPAALLNLRAATKRRLVISVPFQEPEPLWWHDRPGGHRQRFSEDYLKHLFPSAIYCLFPRPGTDWIFVVEDARLLSNSFEITTSEQMLSILARAET
jgi:cyclopropane fatty-acyl-phospholipid synthase-like methyltransferase